MEALVDGRPVDLGAPQQRALLAALVIADGSLVSRTGLIDRLWPEDPPASAPKLVQKYVSALRSALGHGSIVTEGGGYRLAVDPLGIDVTRFEAAIATARSEPASRSRALASAEAEWRGEPYAGCGDHPFVLGERHRLAGVHLGLRLDRLADQLATGATAEVIGELERLAVEHPHDERIAAQLVRSLYGSDRQVEALQAARRLADRLRDDLGLDPSPELVELERQVLDHDEALRVRRDDGERSEVGGDRSPPERVTPGDREEIRAVVIVLVEDPSTADAPEDVRSHHLRFTDEIERMATRLGGVVDARSSGDVVVTFGVPAHDDAERAVALARGVLRVRSTARAAVTGGEALVATEPDARLIAGRPVDRARALVSEAAGGTVVIAPEVDRQLLDQAASHATPMIGRDTEYRIVGDVWARVIDGGRLRLAEVIGEPGIGKTRLLRESVAALEPAPVEIIELSFSAIDDGSVFAVLLRALDQLTGGHADVAAWLDSLAIPPDERRALEAQLAPIVAGTPVDLETAGVDEADALLLRLVELRSAAGPTVLAIEDLHWAPASALESLGDALGHLADRPILVITTRRPQPAVAEPDTSLVAERSTIRLGPLPHGDLRQLADLVGRDLAPEALALAARSSGGNPLFLLQYVRMLLDRPEAADGTAAPDSVRLVISARLDHLAPPLRSTIQVGALLAGELRTDLLAAVTGRDDAEIGAALEVLVRSGLLRRSRRGPTHHGPGYEFEHAVVADVAYGQLTRETRRALHERAARRLAEEAEADLDALQATAWHWRHVIRLAADAGLEIEAETRSAAREAFVRAGDRLLHVDAGLAIEAFRSALDLAAKPDVARADVLVRLGQITTDAGEFDEATGALAEAAAIYDEHGRHDSAGEALARRARALWYLGHADELDELLAGALDRIDRSPPSPAHAHTMAIVAAQTALRGRAAEAIELAERFLPVVEEHGTEEDRVRMLHVRGQARFDLDDERGIDDLEEAVRRTVDRGFGRLASQSYNNLAELVWPARGPAQAVPLASAGLEVAHERGYRGQAPWHHAQLAEIRFDLGEWDAVTTPPDRTIGLTPVVGWLLESLAARISFWRGDDRAVARLDSALASARRSQERQVVVPILSAAISTRALLDDADAAADLGRELVTFAGPHPYNRLREAGEAVRGLTRIGRLDLARQLVPEVAPTIRRRQLMWTTAQASLAEAEERWTEALEGHRRAEDGWAGFPHPFEAAMAALGVSRCAGRLGRAAESVEAAGRAGERFASLGVSRGLDDGAPPLA